ncbi:glycosyltransferase [Micromonospora robiginosa]|uniref:4,4'-diaponeurosporenoate glycosyltransferase n=1 Tax=Micromonospora robiginosa TaxID=2749844 RepID=A0A7L6AZA5_9ACTN|nr:glycosyltransferase [Micromonospora ferruginea]QLQ34916.2 glycosyltransferase [Micromonospora ferruginea]
MNRLAVVVPAHDEQASLPACLASVLDSLRRLPVRAEVIVVADDCRDATAAVARRLGAVVVTVRARNVGRARAAGMAHALRHGPQDLWLATTDADSRVPRRWGGWHLRHGRAGTDLLVGTVRVHDWAPRSEQVRTRFETRYRQGLTDTGHRHVHGANLGCAATAYERLGGFADLRHGEDHDLVDRGRRRALRVVADATCPVRTSARRRSRAPHGFARYLDALDDRPPVVGGRA